MNLRESDWIKLNMWKAQRKKLRGYPKKARFTLNKLNN